MRPKPFMKLLFSVCFILAGIPQVLAANASTTTVELPTVIHFLTPAGDDVEVGPGRYEVETAESWLKLVPEGQGRTEAVLLEATSGSHEETLPEPGIRLEGEAENLEVFHLAILQPDGMGLEAVGTTTGIRPRTVRLSFLTKMVPRNQPFTPHSRTPTKKSFAFGPLPNIALPGPVGQTQAPSSRPKGEPVDCGPYQREIGRSGDKTGILALAVFQNQLHVVAGSGYEYGYLGHMIYDQKTEKWDYSPRPDQQHKGIGGVALAVYQDRLHMVFLLVKESSHDLWHASHDGEKWTQRVKIPGKKSKAAPGLAVWNNHLHMVHLDDSSNALWHSVNKGHGWTVNVSIPFVQSDRTPALGLVPNGPSSGRLHMVFKRGVSVGPQPLWHTHYVGGQWRRPVKIPGALTGAAPTVVSGYPDQLHLIHLGRLAKSSDHLWHMLYGPNKRKNNSVEWFDERRLLSEESQTPVAVALFQGCYHMVSIKGGKLMHTIFSTPQIHPTVR